MMSTIQKDPGDEPAGVAAVASVSGSIPPLNPFVGPVPLSREDVLYGRERETDELVHLIVSKRIVLLFSPSGAGKTSVIQAGLIPRLRELYNLEALPIVRLGNYASTEGVNAKINRYTLTTLLALERRKESEKRLSEGDLSRYSLERYFEELESAGRHKAESGGQYNLLIFDQFEELFTADPLDIEQKREFLAELGRLLAGSRPRPRNKDDDDQAPVWALFAMREDRVAELQPYLDLLPTALAFRYRMDALVVGEALDAIQATAGVWIAPDAAKRLVDDLATISVRTPDGKEVSQRGRFVEPVQMQVVCRGLWEKIVSKGGRINADDVASSEGASEVDRALHVFFDLEVAAAAQKAGVSERKLREWIDRELVTPSGVRTQTLLDPQDKAVSYLIDAHLLRSDSRGGREWVELAHDRLLAPVKAANDAWKIQHLKPFQVLALQYRATGDLARRRQLLITGKELDEANDFAKRHGDDLDASELEFLAVSEQERRRATRERRRVWTAWIAAAAILITAFLGYLLWESKKRTDAYREIAKARDSTSNPEAFAVLVPWHDKSAGIDGSGQLKDFVDRTIRERLARIPAAVVGELRPHGHVVWSLAFTQDGKKLLASSWDGSVSLWNRISLDDNAESGKLTFQSEKEGAGSYALVMYEPTGLVASTYRDGRVVLWRLKGAGLERLGELDRERQPDKEKVTTAAFSSDGHWLAVAGWDKNIQLWDVSDPTSPRHLTTLAASQTVIQKILFLPKPLGTNVERLASTDYNGIIKIWPVTGIEDEHPVPVAQFSINDHQQQAVGISSAAVDQSGKYFVAGDTQGFLHVWDISAASPGKGVRLEGASHGGEESGTQVKSIEFAPHSLEFISAGLDGYLIHWKLPENARDLGELAAGATAVRYGLGERLFSATYRPDTGVGNRDVIAVGGTRSIWLVDLKRGNGPFMSHSLSVADPSAESWSALSVGQAGTGPVIIAAKLAKADAGPGRIHFWRRSRSDTEIVAIPEWTMDISARLAFSLVPAGDRVLTVDCSGQLVEWELREGPASKPSGATTGTSADLCDFPRIAISPDGSVVATAVGAVLRLWERSESGHWREQQWLPGESGQHDDEVVSSLAFNKASDRLAVGAADGSIQLWKREKDVSKWAFSKKSESVGDQVNALAFSRDGTKLKAGGEFGVITEYSLPDLKQGDPDTRHERSVVGLVQTANSGVLISADRGGYIVEWKKDADRTSVTEIEPRFSRSIDAIALSSDGSLLVTAGKDLLAWDFSEKKIRDAAEKIASKAASDPGARKAASLTPRTP